MEASPSTPIDSPLFVLHDLTTTPRHMGRCIYGGLYDPGNSLSDENGYRKDVIESFKELNCPVVRYPGGNFVATYHWQDGIGPRDKRPKKCVRLILDGNWGENL